MKTFLFNLLIVLTIWLFFATVFFLGWLVFDWWRGYPVPPNYFDYL